MSEETANLLILKVKGIEKVLKLLDIPLHGAERRKRNRFLRLLESLVKEYNEELQEIFDNSVEKNPDGSAIEIMPGKFKLKANSTYGKDVAAVKNENVIINITENIPDFLFVKGLLHKIDEEQNMSAEEGIIFDDIIDAFTNVKIDESLKTITT